MYLLGFIDKSSSKTCRQIPHEATLSNHSHTHSYTDGTGSCATCQPAHQEQIGVHLSQGYWMCSYAEVSVVEARLQERERWRRLRRPAAGDWSPALSISASLSPPATPRPRSPPQAVIKPPTFRQKATAVEEKVFPALSTQHMDD